MKLRSHLYRVVFLAVLPGLLCATISVFIYHRQHVAHQQEDLIRAAERFSRDIDRELTASIRTLQVLASSEHLTRGDVKSFHEQATQALAAHGVWHGIALVAPNLEMVANTRVPFGTALPRAGQANLLPEIVKTGKPAISNLFTGPIVKSPLVAVAVPVNRDGQLRWLLVANTAPDFLINLSAEPRVTAGWSGTIIDRDKNVILRTNGKNDDQGQRASPILAQSSRDSTSGFFQETPQGGSPLAQGFYRSELSGWTVGIAQPMVDFNQPLHRSLSLIATVGGVLLAFGLLLATSLERRIAAGIAGLAASAQGGDSEKPTSDNNPTATVEEIRSMAHTLANIAAKRVAAEEALRDSEARLRAIFDQAAVGVAEIDSTSGRLLRVNNKYCHILGYGEDELTQRDFMELTLPEDLAPDLAAMEQLRADEVREFSLEKRLLRKDGTAVWVNLTVSPLWAPGEAPTTHIAVIEDISARKQAESERVRLASIIEAAPDFIGYCDLHGQITYLNPGAKRLLELDTGEPLDNLYIKDFHSDRANRLATETILPTALRDGYWSGETALLTRTGRQVAVLQLVIAHKDEAGNPEYFSTIMRDISERKAAEEKLAGTEKRFRAMIEHSADGIALLAVDGTVAYLSPSATRITGRTPVERVGTNTSSVFHPEDKSIIPDAIAALLRDPRSVQRVELRTRHQDGSWRWLEASLTNCLDDPNVQAIVSNYRDVTARKEAEEELHRVNEEIQQLYETARTLHGGQDLQAMGETILNQALSLSGCDLGVIRLREDANAPIRVIARHGYRDPENLQRHDRSPVGPNSDGTSRPRDRMRVFDLRQTDIVEQLEPDERMATFYREGICSLITIPVTLGDTPHCVMQLGSCRPRRFEPRLVRLLETLAQDFGIAAQKARLLEQALADQERLHELSRRVVDAQESERRYIARELHDEIGSLLSALKIMIKLDGGEAAQSLSVVDEALAKTRAIAQHLRPPMLDDLGLAATLAWYAKEFTSRTKIAVEVEIDGIERRFGNDIEIAVFRIFQEALTNVARHAQASSAVALFSAGANLLRVTILDNGVGFDTKKALERPSSSGLSGMRERVAALGGRIEISRD